MEVFPQNDENYLAGEFDLCPLSRNAGHAAKEAIGLFRGDRGADGNPLEFREMLSPAARRPAEFIPEARYSQGGNKTQKALQL